MPNEKTITEQLDDNMSRALDILNTTNTDNPNYPALLDQITKLHNMREDNKPAQLDKNTLATIAANLAGIVLVTQHERAHVIVSKAFGMLLRAR